MPRRPASLFCASVLRRDVLSPTMVRVVLGGDGLAGWAPTTHSDAYVVLWLPRPGSGVLAPFDLDEVRRDLPESSWPAHRHYSVRRWDAAAGELSIDFVVHGDEGIAGPWARSARVGDRLMVTAPNGGYSPDPAADWHLFVGDESALPAIAASLDVLPPDARAVVVALCDGAEHEIDLDSAGLVDVTWLHRRGDPSDATLLADAVRDLDWPAGRVHAFVHGEAGEVREVRRYLVGERRLARHDLSISGYWRRTLTDEAWRRIKRDWNADVEADVPAVGQTGAA